MSQLLVFRFVSSFALTFFGLPTKLSLGPALTCYFGTLIIVWFLCRGYLAFKDGRNSPDSVGLPVFDLKRDTSVSDMQTLGYIDLALLLISAACLECGTTASTNPLRLNQ